MSMLSNKGILVTDDIIQCGGSRVCAGPVQAMVHGDIKHGIAFPGQADFIVDEPGLPRKCNW